MGFDDLLPSEKVKWLIEGQGLDDKIEQNMEIAADIIEKEVTRYEEIQEKLRREKNNGKQEDEDEILMREVKSAMLLQAMYNLEDKLSANKSSQANSKP
ncbi:hypothetical protein ABK040_005341 [Willaertia magna]